MFVLCFYYTTQYLTVSVIFKKFFQIFLPFVFWGVVSEKSSSVKGKKYLLNPQFSVPTNIFYFFLDRPCLFPMSGGRRKANTKREAKNVCIFCKATENSTLRGGKLHLYCTFSVPFVAVKGLTLICIFVVTI